MMLHVVQLVLLFSILEECISFYYDCDDAVDKYQKERKKEKENIKIKRVGNGY